MTQPVITRLPDAIGAVIGGFLDPLKNNEDASRVNRAFGASEETLFKCLGDQLSKMPFFKEAFEREKGKPVKEMCKRAVSYVNRALEAGRLSFFRDKELKAMGIDPRSEISELTYEQRVRMGEAIAKHRAIALISFFEDLAAYVSEAQEFLNTLPVTLNNEREKAREIRRWMQENREMLAREFVVEVPFRWGPRTLLSQLTDRFQIPKEVIPFLTYGGRRISEAEECCWMWISMGHLEPLYEILKDPRFQQMREDNLFIKISFGQLVYPEQLKALEILMRFEGVQNLSVEDLESIREHVQWCERRDKKPHNELIAVIDRLIAERN